MNHVSAESGGSAAHACAGLYTIVQQRCDCWPQTWVLLTEICIVLSSQDEAPGSTVNSHVYVHSFFDSHVYHGSIRDSMFASTAWLDVRFVLLQNNSLHVSFCVVTREEFKGLQKF